MSWFWLVSAILFEVVGTLGLRASDGLSKRRWLILVALSYTVSFIFLRFALEEGVPVGIAYGLWTALGIVLIALFARVVWKEALTKRMLVGMALIIVGVFLIELG